MQKDRLLDGAELVRLAEQLGMGDPWSKGPHTSLPAKPLLPVDPRSSRTSASDGFSPHGLRAMRSQPLPKEGSTETQAPICSGLSMKIILRHRKPSPPPPEDA